MAVRTVLWADLRMNVAQPYLYGQLPARYGIRRVNRVQDVFRFLHKRVPWAACIEVDAPDAGKLDSVAEIKRLYHALPIILLAGSQCRQLAAWAKDHAFHGLLIEPVSVQDLCGCLAMIDGPKCQSEVCSGNKRCTGVTVAADAGRRSTPLSAAAPAAESLASALSYVEANYVEKLRMSTVAKLCNLSPFQFSRAFKKEHGVSFRDFVVRTRIHRAAQLMEESDMSVTDAAFGVGFNDCSYFARMFRRELGECPSRYRAGALRGQLPLFPAPERGASAVLQKTTSPSAKDS